MLDLWSEVFLDLGGDEDEYRGRTAPDWRYMLLALMPIKIALRTNTAASPFRDMLLSILHPSTGDEAIICSAYIWEPMNGTYKILSDGLQAAIQAGCPKGVTTVAGKLSSGNYSSFYTNFVNRLGAVMPVKAYKAPLNNWHSKVAIRLDSGRPVAAVIGSSNLTGPAYGLNMPVTPYTPGWNYETDVLIWDGASNVGAVAGAELERGGLGYISAILDPAVGQPSEAEQLDFILQLVQNEIGGFEPVNEG